DIIIEAEGQSVDEFDSYTELVSVITGEAGTDVTVSVLRGSEVKSFTMTRATVYNPGIEARMIGDIGYLAIDGFDRNVDVEFSEKLNQLINEGAKGLIFDVRFNGG